MTTKPNPVVLDSPYLEVWEEKVLPNVKGLSVVPPLALITTSGTTREWKYTSPTTAESITEKKPIHKPAYEYLVGKVYLLEPFYLWLVKAELTTIHKSPGWAVVDLRLAGTLPQQSARHARRLALADEDAAWVYWENKADQNGVKPFDVLLQKNTSAIGYAANIDYIKHVVFHCVNSTDRTPIMAAAYHKHVVVAKKLEQKVYILKGGSSYAHCVDGWCKVYNMPDGTGATIPW